MNKMRTLFALSLLCAPLTLAADVDIEALLDETRLFLDSHIGATFPDAEVRSLRSRESKRLSSLQVHGLLIIYANSPCKWAIRAAELMSDRGWEWNGSPAIVLLRKWRKTYRKQFLAELPEGAPVYQLKLTSPPEWLGEVKTTPLLFLVGPDMAVLDWSGKVPGDPLHEDSPLVSRLGSQLVRQPPD
jgi:hypothetical protein